MRCSRYWTSTGLIALFAACVTPAARAQSGDLPPAGYGTLRQDQIGVRLVTSAIAVRVIPLDERVIRLLAVDAYQSLHAMAAAKSRTIDSTARSVGRDSASLFMVTWYGLQPQTQFSPDQLYITSQGREYRPLGIIPLTNGFSEARLDQRMQALGIYVYEPGIDVMRTFTVTYQDSTSDAWTQSLQLLDAERNRARSRAQAAQPNGGGRR